MRKYRNIEKIETPGDGTTSVWMKEGRQAIIEIVRAGDRFRARVFRMLTGDPPGTAPRRRRNPVVQMYHDGTGELLREVLGWVDEHPGKFVAWKEMPKDPQAAFRKKKSPPLKTSKPYQMKRGET